MSIPWLIIHTIQLSKRILKLILSLKMKTSTLKLTKNFLEIC